MDREIGNQSLRFGCIVTSERQVDVRTDFLGASAVITQWSYCTPHLHLLLQLNLLLLSSRSGACHWIGLKGICVWSGHRQIATCYLPLPIFNNSCYKVRDLASLLYHHWVQKQCRRPLFTLLISGRLTCPSHATNRFVRSFPFQIQGWRNRPLPALEREDDISEAKPVHNLRPGGSKKL